MVTEAINPFSITVSNNPSSSSPLFFQEKESKKIKDPLGLTKLMLLSLFYIDDIIKKQKQKSQIIFL